MNGTFRSRESEKSTDAFDGAHDRLDSGATDQSSHASSITVKANHPVPVQKAKEDTYEGTVRRAGGGPMTEKGTGVRREGSDEYDDYDRDYEAYPAGSHPAEDDLPDSTMLDSVVLPAIASVRIIYSRP